MAICQLVRRVESADIRDEWCHLLDLLSIERQFTLSGFSGSNLTVDVVVANSTTPSARVSSSVGQRLSERAHTGALPHIMAAHRSYLGKDMNGTTGLSLLMSGQPSEHDESVTGVQGRSRWRWRTPLAIAIGAVVIASGVASYFALIPRTGKTNTVVDDGPTFYQALGQLNRTVGVTPGGPWILYTAYGVATPVPFSPNALGWISQNLTVNSCGALFNGLTLWNGSIPLFNGTMDSGTAPFWQIMYFSNSSQSILVATDVLGNPHVYSAIPMTSPCMMGSSLASDPWGWAKVLDPLPVDSPPLARSAVNALGAGWFANNPGVFEAYRFGSNYWGSGNPAGLVINFERCGEVGRAGVQPAASVGVSSAGDVVTRFVGVEGCGNVAKIGPPPVLFSFQLGFSRPSTVVSGESMYITAPFQALLTNRSGTVSTDASGIVSWMVRLNLTNAAGVALPVAGSSCSEWVSSTGNCVANKTGWFPALQSPSGAWLDSYGATSSGVNWSVPDVSLVSNQQVVIVCPTSWNVTGDILVASSMATDAPVSGSVALP